MAAQVMCNIDGAATIPLVVLLARTPDISGMKSPPKKIKLIIKTLSKLFVVKLNIFGGAFDYDTFWNCK